MKKYSVIFLDLDNTILDFNFSEKIAVKSVLKDNGLLCDDKTANLYSDINKFFWQRFENGEIKKEEIYVERFIMLFDKLNIKADAKKVSDDYFIELAKCHHLADGALYVLDELKKRGYTLYATTNGVKRTQNKRIKEAGLNKYFDFICISEEIGYQKPQKEYFDFCINKTGLSDKGKILVVGDSESSDVLGAKNAGLDICWLNSFNKKSKFSVDYEINKITDLLSVLN